MNPLGHVSKAFNNHGNEVVDGDKPVDERFAKVSLSKREDYRGRKLKRMMI